MPWSEWFPLNSTNPAPGNANGVYKIRITDDTGAVVLIPRTLGVDSEGLVYIGQGYLRTRISVAMDLNSPKPHSQYRGRFAKTWQLFNLDRIGDRRRLQVQWRVCEPGATSLPEEQQELIAYKLRFGDLPPGNVKLGG